jgi:hypothetical protein
MIYALTTGKTKLAGFQHSVGAYLTMDRRPPMGLGSPNATHHVPSPVHQAVAAATLSRAAFV